MPPTDPKSSADSPAEAAASQPEQPAASAAFAPDPPAAAQVPTEVRITDKRTWLTTGTAWDHGPNPTVRKPTPGWQPDRHDDPHSHDEAHQPPRTLGQRIEAWVYNTEKVRRAAVAFGAASMVAFVVAMVFPSVDTAALLVWTITLTAATICAGIAWRFRPVQRDPAAPAPPAQDDPAASRYDEASSVRPANAAPPAADQPEPSGSDTPSSSGKERN